MPFKSEKQRKWMHANEPEMAKKWEKEEVIRGKLRNLIKQEIKSVNEARLVGYDKSYLKNAKKRLKVPHEITKIEYKRTPLRSGVQDKFVRIWFKHKWKPGRWFDPEERWVSVFYDSPERLKMIGKTLKLKLKESVNESDLGLTYKKGKTVKVTHKKSGKELIIIDKPNVKREYEKIGYFAEGKINEGFEKYHLGGLGDSKLKNRLERAIKIWGGKVDAVGDDYIKFRLGSFEVKKFPALLKKLDRNKNVWIGDKRKNNIWDRRQRINKLEATTSVSVPGYLSPQAFKKSTQNAIDVDDEDDEKSESINERKLSSHQKKAILIAIEMSGNMTGAVKKIERIKKGLSNDKKVKDALRLANESMAAPFRRRNSRGLGRVMKVGLNELQMAPFSSQEARLHIDADIKKMSKELGKASHDIIKMMMDGVKRGRYTPMDISRGIKEGPAKRTHFGELTFIQQLWNKVREKFRRYSKHGKLS